jgi:hypothetical protein
LSEGEKLYDFLYFIAPTQFKLYGTETVKMILANLRCYKLKATPGVKTTSLAGAKKCKDSSYSNPFGRL